MWPATTLAPSFSALEADVAAQLAPVRGIERSQLRADWHCECRLLGSSPLYRRRRSAPAARGRRCRKPTMVRDNPFLRQTQVAKYVNRTPWWISVTCELHSPLVDPSLSPALAVADLHARLLRIHPDRSSHIQRLRSAVYDNTHRLYGVPLEFDRNASAGLRMRRSSTRARPAAMTQQWRDRRPSPRVLLEKRPANADGTPGWGRRLVIRIWLERRPAPETRPCRARKRHGGGPRRRAWPPA